MCYFIDFQLQLHNAKIYNFPICIFNTCFHPLNLPLAQDSAPHIADLLLFMPYTLSCIIFA